MADNLKQKTTNSIIWNAIDKVGFQVIALVVGIVTARLLSPDDFGLIGALAIFTLLSNILVESGFTSAMIRRNDNTDAEYSAVFYFNLFFSILFYIILFFAAPFIAAYFNMPELCDLSRFLFFSVILNSLGFVQNIIPTKNLAFNILTTANIASVFLSGVITIILIYCDFGYWSLAWQQVLQIGFRTLLLWILSPWRLTRRVDFRVIKELFSFSIFLLSNSVFTTTVRYIYNFIIGRLYTRNDLGYYYQAFKYQQISSTIISGTLSGVAYPVLSELNNDPKRQLLYFRKIMRIAAFATFPAMTVLCVMAEPLFRIVLSEKWLSSVPYFQILSIAALAAPFHSLNLGLITVKGFSKRMFFLETIRNIFVIISLLLCIESIKSMLIGFCIAGFLSYIIDLFFVRKITGYKMREQLTDILPYGIISTIMGILVYLISTLDFNLYLKTTVQLICGCSFYFFSLYLLGSKVTKDAIELFIPKRQ